VLDAHACPGKMTASTKRKANVAIVEMGGLKVCFGMDYPSSF
jgi:hypothetical protein